MKTLTNNTPTSSKKQTEATAEVIKLGIDIHKKKYVVVRMIDQQGSQSPQRFTPHKFLSWVKKQSGKNGVKRKTLT